MNPQHFILLSGISAPPLPPVPSREDVCKGRTSGMQGLFLQTNQFGLMPWWDACLPWCNAETRQLAYAAKRARGDTHCIIELPDGKPLYDEPGQFYSPDKFGPLDMTSGQTKIDQAFIDLVTEVVREGFKFILILDETEADSFRCMHLLMPVLKSTQLYRYGYVMPGWDGVFYVWQDASIQLWSQIARVYVPDCYLGLEQPNGKPPLGLGEADYDPGGRMTDFDVVVGEFIMWEPHDDNIWQILPRMCRPYNRPADQPRGDDPNPPFYLGAQSPRGPYYYWIFETFTYVAVRVNVNDPNAVAAQLHAVNQQSDYLAQCSPDAPICR